MVENPVGLKIGGSMKREKLGKIVRTINPKGEAGKVLPILRLDTDSLKRNMKDLLEELMENGITMGVYDPMHAVGKTKDPKTGRDTRDTRVVDRNLMHAQLISHECGFHLAGVSLEASGEDVTECIGSGIENLDENYQSLCDPCFNLSQAVVQLRLFNGRKLAMG
jgi:3-deoxy-7-phosphoheptulonate synthase